MTRARPERIAAGLYHYQGMEIRKGVRDLGSIMANGHSTKRGWRIRPVGGVWPGWLPRICDAWRDSLLAAVRAIDAEIKRQESEAASLPRANEGSWEDACAGCGYLPQHCECD